MPRSPSRDLSDRYDRHRGYFRNPDPLRKARLALTVVAFLAAFAWVVVDVWKPAQRVQYSHSHGRLANPHAAFDNNCEACHKAHGLSEAFNPISWFKARDRWHDLTCEKCHAGPAHHASYTEEANDMHNRCSTCHHDHNGRAHSLVRLQDKDCNVCHADLDEKKKGGQLKWYHPDRSFAHRDGQPYVAKVSNFVTDHPEFRSLDISTKPRTLTFSHAIHMNPGQAYSATGNEAMTVGRLRAIGGEAAVARYAPKGAADGEKITLDCASCHTLDSGAGSASAELIKGTLGKGEPVNALLPMRTEGAYFLPVTFEAHCRSCHPTRAGESVADGQGDGKSVAFRVPPFEVSHRKQPVDLFPELKAGYLKGLSNTGAPELKRPPVLGGKLYPHAKGAGPLPVSAQADRFVKDAGNLLFAEKGSCAKCHKVAPGDPPYVVPVPDRTVWFKHAKFNHASHRGADCSVCHPGTGPKYLPPTEADLPEPVQILGRDTCRACHAPPGTTVKLPDGSEVAGGGARHACTDCHRYHNGDFPYQGRGAAARNTEKPLGLKDWLTGSIKKN